MENENSVKEVMKKLKEEENLLQTETLLEDNKCSFKFKDNDYRVRIPERKEILDIEKAKGNKLITLLSDGTMKLKEEWIKIYQSRGLDIVEMECRVKDYDKEIEKLQIPLIEAKEDVIRERIIKEIEELKEKQTELILKIDKLLEYCIETVLNEYEKNQLALIALEKKEGDNWVKAYKTYEDFMNSDDDLFLKTHYYLSYIVYRRQIL